MTDAPGKTLLSLGHGYSARALAARIAPEGWTVIGTTRSAEKLEAGHAEMHLWPGTDLAPLAARASHVLLNAGPTEEGDPFLPEIGSILAETRPDWIGYLSTTGVYGDHSGEWVDEETPLTPSTRRGEMRLQAESAWQSLAATHGLPLHIFRLAGIYGPGRGPFTKVRAGTARRIIKPGQVFSRIHVEDIAQVLAASMARPDPGAIYNLCDDDPAPPQDVIAHAAELLGLPVPEAIPFEEAELTPMARSFYAESKRVRNDRIKRDLGVELLFPTYREGLGALLRDA
ncbi:SDR family oxidoreductase [Vannielia litorea]|uniref:SDR family oxidoreductase n=1 Tax=Vannielia litorea TaxID=1217970 RepID=UPI001C986D89|nr:SDR family oxidoreductase [Vannielia litorea]MBY6049458.1 SDR family oxidoreductase [Vannielia litorea]MBY6076872.1 SDR family oxidoreductase [Vannielia litorea]